jgi:Protein of unknown function DUF262
MHLNHPEVEDMPTRESGKVNLDALIVRQDMDTGEPKKVSRSFSFGYQSLIRDSGITYALLRKPDFQRSTSIWTPEKVRDMVVAYLEGDTVPGVIVWRSPKNDLFVIDGAHRLSSIIAWINDDYGDGDISIAHYGEPQNKAAADRARKLVEDSVGKFVTVANALRDELADPKHVEGGALV